MQKCYLAMGCFWKPEEQFKTQKGIIDTEVGYAGGYKSKVTYEEVCQGNTGHAEIVKLSFDENIISYEKILKLFFIRIQFYLLTYIISFQNFKVLTKK